MTHANRGAGLERLIDLSNKQYKEKGIADVRKIPTPVRITGNSRGRITGFVTRGELVDYIGVFRGRGIAFDAKQTASKTSFPLSNIPAHQFDFLKSWSKNEAEAFLIVEFTEHNEIYKVPFALLYKYWKAAEKGGRKSIPYKDFQALCELLKSGNGIPLNYLM